MCACLGVSRIFWSYTRNIFWVQYELAILRINLKTMILILGSTYDLVIVVISARDHFQQRHAIRSTWWGEILTMDNMTDR